MDGLLLIDKPAGITSMDVIRRVRKVLDTRKVGHTGTLDPAATGLLPVTIGACTKLAKFLTLEPKVYDFEVVFGTLTETADDEGAPVATGPSDVSEADLLSVIPEFLGEIDQTPPRYSALRVNGKRAYELARAGIEFELESRRIHIHALSLHRLEPGLAMMQVTCGSGTYVRALAVDLAAKLGTVAHARHIRRLRVGSWRIEDAVALDDVTPEHVAPALAMLAELECVELDTEQWKRVLHGNSLVVDGVGPDGFCALTYDGQLIAVADRRGSELQPRRVLADGGTTR